MDTNTDYKSPVEMGARAVHDRAERPAGPPVEEALEALDKRVAVLDEVVAHLYERSTTILADATPEDPTGPLAPFGSSVLSARIGDAASRIAYLTERIQSFTRRLEV